MYNNELPLSLLTLKISPVKNFYRTLICGVLFALALTSCEKEETESGTLSVSQTSLSFGAVSPAAQMVEITTDAPNWTASLKNSADQQWVGLSTTDKRITVKLQDHENITDPRTATIVITAGKARPVEITVSQTARGINTLSVSANPVTYAYGEISVKNVTVTTDAASWKVTGLTPGLSLYKEGSILAIHNSTVNNTVADITTPITITAGNAPAVTLSVIQKCRQPVTYNAASGIYYETDPGTFLFDLYNASDTKVGLRLQGFSALPTGTNAFAIAPGAYTVGASGTGHFVAGALSGTTLSGSFVYNQTTQQYIAVTGGTLNVAVSGTTYTISTDLTGYDVKSGDAAVKLVYNYTGALSLVRDYQTGIRTWDDLVSTTYQATATPRYLTTPGPKAFMGQFQKSANSSGTDFSWAMTNWGGVTVDGGFSLILPIIELVNGNLLLDTRSVVARSADRTVNGYFQAMTYNPTTEMMTFIPKYRVTLDVATKTLDFTGTYNGLPVYVGVVARDAATGAMVGAFTEIYEGAKVKLSKLGTTAIVSGAPMFIEGEPFVLSDGSSLKKFVSTEVPAEVKARFTGQVPTYELLQGKW